MTVEGTCDQQVRAVATKFGYLRLIPGTHMVKGKSSHVQVVL